MEFGNQILETVLKYVKLGLNVETIVIPTNVSFSMYPELIEVMNYYIDAFKELNVKLRLSASVDGAVVESDNRPFKNSSIIKTQSFYDNMFKFCKDNNLGFHPMIDASTIESQIENYDWWIDQYKKFNMYDRETWYDTIMFLEVRNDSWSADKIMSYLKWLNYVIDTDIKNLWDNNTLEYILNIPFRLHSRIKLYNTDGTVFKRQFLTEDITNYSPVALYESNENKFACNVGTMLNIRLGDLSFIPCHRTSYEKLIYGKFDYDNKGITGITANNPGLMFNILAQGKASLFKCDGCLINKFCVRGCLGSQLEATEELLYPIDSVCDLNTARFMFLCVKLDKLIENCGLEDKLKLPESVFSYRKVLEGLRGRNSEVVDKWLKMLQEMI